MRLLLTFALAVIAAPAAAQSDSTAAADTTARSAAGARTAPARSAGGSPETFHPGIKYLGGVGFPDFKGHESWDNTMTVTADSVLMAFADTTYHPLGFKVADVTRVEYGQAASRHTGRWVALGVLVAPVALFGLFHKSRHHFVAITYNDGGQERGVYFEANKDLFRNLLNTLSYRSGQPIYADEKDRKWLLTQGVMAQLDPDAKDAK